VSSVVGLVKEIEFKTKTKIKFGDTQERIMTWAAHEYGDKIGVEEAKQISSAVIANYGDFELIQKIMRSKIVQEIDGRDLLILDKENKQVIKIIKEKLKEILSPKLDISDRVYTCLFKYDPKKYSQLSKDKKGNWIYNTYKPANWQEKSFYLGHKIEKLDELPEMYSKFFKHLFDNDIASIKYVLDWLTNCLKSRNVVMLTTIGKKGVGKGTFGEILRELAGDDNFETVGNSIFTEKFNGQLKNKTIVFIDEASIKGQKEEERLKVLVNNFVSVEAKGKDAKSMQNYASFYMSSNSMDSLRLSADERRYSIVSLTDVNLRSVMPLKDIKALSSPENVEQLARYLYYREIDEDKMLSPFLSDRTEEVRNAGLSTWQDWFLDEYAVDKAGQLIKVDILSEAVAEKYPKIAPGKKAFKDLEDVYPAKLRVYKPIIDGKQVWAVKFPDKEIK
jgi:hypothetical protein